MVDDTIYRAGTFNITGWAQEERRFEMKLWALGSWSAPAPATVTPTPEQMTRLGGRRWSQAHLNLTRSLADVP